MKRRIRTLARWRVSLRVSLKRHAATLCVGRTGHAYILTVGARHYYPNARGYQRQGCLTAWYFARHATLLRVY